MHGHAPTRRGFTLTELLVVIAIIAILVSLTSVGVMRAMATARATRIKTELDQIDSAFKAFKEKYGAYPPCDFRTSDPQAMARLRQFVAMAFPRYDLTQLQNELQQTGLDLTNFRPDQAVYFWLRGFSSDPQHPFVTPGNAQIIGNNVPNPSVRLTLTPLFEFDTARLLAVGPGGDPLPSYFPSGVRTQSTPGTTFAVWESGGAPILYWDARHYQAIAAAMGQPAESHQFNFGGFVPFANAGVAAPYWFDANGNGLTNDTADLNSGETWANPDSFQLIACGIDGRYGNQAAPPIARLYPTGTNYDTSPAMADDDNATNFSSKARIGDDRP